MNIPSDLYDMIIRSMPIPCVDLIVINNQKKILLLLRKNEPVKGQWWFPGGRVHFNELREDAARRILKAECGLEGIKINELGTFDVLLNVSSENRVSHGITTLFYTCVSFDVLPVLDEQSLAYEWRTIKEWKMVCNRNFVFKGLTYFFAFRQNVKVNGNYSGRQMFFFKTFGEFSQTY